MDTNIVAIAGLAISAVTLLCLVGGGFYWWGRLSSRVDGLENRVDELSEDMKATNAKIDAVRDELIGKMDSMQERQDGKIDAVRDELIGKMDSMQERQDGKIDAVRDELNGKIDAVRDELIGKMDAMQERQDAKMDSMRTEILTEMRRSEERILTALAYHSHIAPEAGRAVFWQPIGSTTPAYPPGEGAPAAGQPEAEAPAA